MNYKILLVTGILLSSFFLTGCEEKENKPECEKNDYGRVKITNETGLDDLVVKINQDKRTLSNEETTTYDEVDEGNVTLWASLERNSRHDEELFNLNACEEMRYTIDPPQCANGDFGWVHVKNETGEDGLYVDVTTANSDYNEERTISNGEKTTYEMDAGNLRIWASWTGNSDDWQYFEEDLNVCEGITFRLTSGKKNNSTKVSVYQDNKQIKTIELFDKRKTH